MFTLKHCPSTPMSQKEMQEQCRMVSEAALATEYFTEDELEEYAEKLKRDSRGQGPSTSQK